MCGINGKQLAEGTFVSPQLLFYPQRFLERVVDQQRWIPPSVSAEPSAPHRDQLAVALPGFVVHQVDTNGPGDRDKGATKGERKMTVILLMMGALLALTLKLTPTSVGLVVFAIAALVIAFNDDPIFTAADGRSTYLRAGLMVVLGLLGGSAIVFLESDVLTPALLAGVVGLIAVISEWRGDRKQSAAKVAVRNF